MPSRFTEAEARRIFAAAAERQRGAAAPLADHLSLEELQEIGRAAGLDPADVAAAAADLRHAAEPVRTWHGVPLGTARTRVLPSDVTDAEWERIVDALRDHFKVDGTAEPIGRRREWTHRVGTAVVVRVRLEPAEGGTRVSVASGSPQEGVAGTLLGAIFGAMALLFGGIGLATGELGLAVGIGGLFLLTAVLMYSVTFLTARHKAHTLPARYDALLDRIELLARSEDANVRLDDAPLAEAAASSERIAPAVLNDEAPDGSPPAARRGARS